MHTYSSREGLCLLFSECSKAMSSWPLFLEVLYWAHWAKFFFVHHLILFSNNPIRKVLIVFPFYRQENRGLEDCYLLRFTQSLNVYPNWHLSDSKFVSLMTLCSLPMNPLNPSEPPFPSPVDLHFLWRSVSCRGRKIAGCVDFPFSYLRSTDLFPWPIFCYKLLLPPLQFLFLLLCLFHFECITS